MQLQDKYRIAVLSAYALVLYGFEGLVPTPIPWLRLGLANIITLVALMLYGLRTAMTVTLIRVILASVFTGTFLGPAFMLSFAGGVSSTAAMGLTYLVFRNLFGPVGLSHVALFITDRYGELYAQWESRDVDGLPPLADALKWLTHTQLGCAS